MNMETARKLLPEARQLAGLVSDEWAESYNLDTKRPEICVRDALTGEIVPIAELQPSCTYDDRRLMFQAPTLLRGLLFLLDASFDEIRRLNPKPTPDGNFAAECAMKCGQRLFQTYLAEKHQVDTADHERINTRVRSMLGIRSRAELNTNPEAAARWKSLRADFDAWRNHL